MRPTLIELDCRLRHLIVWLLLLPGCKDDDGKCLPPATSSISYSYTGAITGTFSVQGEVPSSSSPNFSIYHYTWAMGNAFREFGDSWINIHGNLLQDLPLSINGSLVFQMHVPDTGVGKYPLPNRGLDFLTLEYDPGWDGTLLFDFVSGEVEVTYSQCNRIIGTFSGRLEGYNNGEVVKIQVSEGKFDVKVRGR